MITKKFMATCKIRYWYGPSGMKDIDEYKEVVDLINKRNHLVFEGVYTHFASADEPGSSMNEQYTLFKDG